MTTDVLFHLGYEWWMFRAAHDLVARLPPDDDPVRNALIESMVAHGRGLIYFFYHPKAKATDWNATDLGIAIDTEPPDAKEWRERANQHLAHITNARLTPIPSWDASQLRTTLSQKIDQVREVCADSLNQWVGDLPSRSRHLRVIGPEGSVIQNTAPVGATGAIGP